MRRLMLAALAACLLCSCGGNNTFSPTAQGPQGPQGCQLPAIASKLLGKTWIGQFDCGATQRMLRLNFSANGCNVLVTGQAQIYAGTSDISYAGFGTGTLDPETGAFTSVGEPVTINGNQATFKLDVLANNPSGNNTVSPVEGVLIVPGTTFTGTYTVTISDNSLTGTYSTTQAAQANQTGNICFSPEAVAPADLAGHWAGAMSGTANVGPGTLNFTVVMNGSEINLASQGTFTDSEVTVQLAQPIGVDGIVIGNQVLFGITFEHPVAGAPQGHGIQHRWFYGTLNGNTITGTFSDTVTPQGQGTFTITRGS